jgi:hypothetical protein
MSGQAGADVTGSGDADGDGAAEFVARKVTAAPLGAAAGSWSQAAASPAVISNAAASAPSLMARMLSAAIPGGRAARHIAGSTRVTPAEAGYAAE